MTTSLKPIFSTRDGLGATCELLEELANDTSKQAKISSQALLTLSSCIEFQKNLLELCKSIEQSKDTVDSSINLTDFNQILDEIDDESKKSQTQTGNDKAIPSNTPKLCIFPRLYFLGLFAFF